MYVFGILSTNQELVRALPSDQNPNKNYTVTKHTQLSFFIIYYYIVVIFLRSHYLFYINIYVFKRAVFARFL